MTNKSIHSNSPTPIRAQLKELLLQEIRSGRFKPGGRIPSEREIAEQYGISRASVRESITELLNSGVLFRTVGKGTFVSSDEISIPAIRPDARLHNIGFIISENIFHFVQTGYNKILGGVQQVCTAQGWRLLFHTVGDDSTSPALLSLRNKGQLTLDGCVIVGGVRRHVLDLLRDEQIPTVLVDLLVADNPEMLAVTIDYAQGARLAMEHLYELGHRKIGYIGFSGAEKYRGYWECLEELGLPYDPRYVEFLQMLDLQPGILAGFQAIQRMIAARRLPSALLVTNDFVALGVIEGLSIAGIRVPEQMSIVGFDDLGQKTSPPLTTVRVDLTQVGRLAANALLRKLNAQKVEAQHTRVAVELVVRGTTAPVTPAVLVNGG